MNKNSEDMEKETSQKETQWEKKEDYQNTYQFVKNPIFSGSNKEWKGISLLF